MKYTGITRKIDELGRIVIPKEIRKNLSIKDGELLEIYIDNDYIVLKKHSFLKNYLDVCKKILDTFNKSLNFNYYLTDREQIIYSNKRCDKLNDYLYSLIDNRQSYKSNKYESLLINNISIDGYLVIKPIIIDSVCVGLLIISSEEKSNYDELSKIIISLINNEILIY